MELNYQSLDLPMSVRAIHDLSLYTAEPGTTNEERLKLLASWSAPSLDGGRKQPDSTRGHQR